MGSSIIEYLSALKMCNNVRCLSNLNVFRISKQFFCAACACIYEYRSISVNNFIMMKFTWNCFHAGALETFLSSCFTFAPIPVNPLYLMIKFVWSMKNATRHWISIQYAFILFNQLKIFQTTNVKCRCSYCSPLNKQ